MTTNFNDDNKINDEDAHRHTRIRYSDSSSNIAKLVTPIVGSVFR